MINIVIFARQNISFMSKIILFIIAFSILSINIFGQSIISRIESLQSLHIETYRDNKPLKTATGFIIFNKNKYYLITNWHVVTNKNSWNKKWIDNTIQVEPNKLKIFHVINENIVKYQIVNLEDFDGTKYYKEYQFNTEMVDVVSIPIFNQPGIKYYPVDYKTNQKDIYLEPTERIFICGFPLGKHSAPYLPIWKSGLIASEPEIDQQNKPIMWIDVESFGGMSGSPTYYISSNIKYKPKDNKTTSTSNLFGTSTFFIGIFSHRIDSIGIGCLWKAPFLEKLFDELD